MSALPQRHLDCDCCVCRGEVPPYEGGKLPISWPQEMKNRDREDDAFEAAFFAVLLVVIVAVVLLIAGFRVLR